MTVIRSGSTQETLFRSAMPVVVSGGDLVRSFEEARSAMIAWANAFSLVHFGTMLENASGVQSPIAFTIETARAGLRIVDSDDAGDISPFGVSYRYESKTARGRGEATLSVEDGRIMLSERVFGVYGDVFGEPVVTRFAASRCEIVDAGVRVTGAVTSIVDDAAVNTLWDLLTTEDRRLPVVVVSEPYLLDTRILAERLYGVAHVNAISNQMTFVLRGLAGRDFAVFGGAVRFYGDIGPGSASYVMLATTLNAALQIGRADHLVLSRAYSYARGMASRLRGVSLEEVESQLLAPATPPVMPALTSLEPDALPVNSVEPVTIAEPIPEVLELRARVDQLQAELDTRETEYLVTLDELERSREISTPTESTDLGQQSGIVFPAVRNLMAAIQLLTEATHEIQNDFEAIRSEADASAREAVRLRRRLARLEKVVPLAPIVRPTTLDPDDVDEWVERRFEGRLELHARALGTLAVALYDRPEDVFHALETLGDHYHAMRTRSPEENESRLQWEEALREAGLRFSGSISDVEFGKQRRLYTVPYRGVDRRLDFHLRNGGGTADPRRAMRIYFFWDAEESRVVIGSLPEHLPNSLS